MKFTQIYSEPTSNYLSKEVVEIFLKSDKYKIIHSLDKLAEYLLSEIDEKTIIDGGHYSLIQEKSKIIHQPTSLTILMFHLTILLFLKSLGKQKKINIGFLINDIGLTLEARKEIKKDFVIHHDYINILKKYNLTINNITELFFESNLRNRAARLILKAGEKSSDVKESDKILFVDSKEQPDFQNQMGYKKDNRLIPFCRAIMAQKLKDEESAGYSKAINLITENEFKCTGEFAKIYQILGGKMPVVNIVFSDFEITNKERDEYNYDKCFYEQEVFLLNSDKKCFIEIQKYLWK